MANSLNTMYPPEIESFRPAFAVSDTVKIYFSFSKYNVADPARLHLHYAVADQQTNKSVVNDPSQIKYVNTYSTDEAGRHYFEISPDDIQGGWTYNKYYKLQIRFDSNGYSGGNWLSYINNMDNQNEYFSEWSKVCLLRPILKPSLQLSKFSDDNSERGVSFTRGIIPISGTLRFDNDNNDKTIAETETLQYYKVIVRNKQTDEEVFSSEQIYTGDQKDQNQIYYELDTQGFDEDGTTAYILRIEYITRNQYESSQEWNFNVHEYINDPDFEPEIEVCLDNERGVASIHITNEATVFGVLYVKRSDSSSNFRKWDVFKILVVGQQYSDSPGPIDITLEDSTISSLMWYRYSVQLQNKYGNFTQLRRSSIVFPQFYDVFLSRMEKKVPIKYNYKISSFKPMVNRVKFDTLGGKYPKFAENAVLDYKQFSVNGLMSAQADQDAEFLDKKEWFGVYTGEEVGFYEDYLVEKTYEPQTWYQNTLIYDEEDEPIVPQQRTMLNRIDKVNDSYDPDNCVHSSWPIEIKNMDENYDFFWEREYREELTKWLNDGEPKLYRSMTEGNMCVMLMDINLTPNTTLGRRIWDFSMTVYEVEDGYSLNTLYDLGIIDIYSDFAKLFLDADGKFDLQKTIQYVTDDGETVEISLQDPFILVTKPGQVYLENGAENLISDVISKTISEKYTYSSSNMIPSDYTLNNVKIFFYDKPKVFLQDSNGNLYLAEDDNSDKTENKPTYTNVITNEQENGYRERYILGYRLRINGKIIFVPSKPGSLIPYLPESEEVYGYYYLPKDTEVSEITFLDKPDKVTVDYIVTYRENISGANTDIVDVFLVKEVVGQLDGFFDCDVWLRDRIYERYNLVISTKEDIVVSHELQSWSGICVEAEPYSIVEIKYAEGDQGTVLMVGKTGILHLSDTENLVDIRFIGRRLFVNDNSDIALKEWECREGSDMDNPLTNHIYDVGGSKVIWYHNNFWPVEYEKYNGIPSYVVKAPIYGQLNYKGDLLEVTRKTASSQGQ